MGLALGTRESPTLVAFSGARGARAPVIRSAHIAAQPFIEIEISAATCCFRAVKRHGAKKIIKHVRLLSPSELTREPCHGIDPA